MKYVRIAKASVPWSSSLCVSVWVGAGASMHRACVIRGQPWVLFLGCRLSLVGHRVSHWLGFHHAEQVSWSMSFHGSSCLCPPS